MSAFETAKKFFEACEAPGGWAACSGYVEDGAPFSCQAAPLTEIRTIEAYTEWLHGFGTVTAPDASYTLDAACYDEASRSAMFFATYKAKHTGDGGPVPPTNRETRSHYVYILEMSDNDKVAAMTKVWNASWALRELGWAE